MKYINQFLSLKCSGDVLNICNPINKPEKEISEAMGVMRHIKPIVLADKNKQFILIDLCAGNALASILAVHLFKNVNAMAVDLKPPDRDYTHTVKRFIYLKYDIYSDIFMDLIKQESKYEWIFISIHPCKKLAERVGELFWMAPSAKHLILMPCCRDRSIEGKYPALLKKKLGGYLLWCYYLADDNNGDLIQDKNILSPCNAIVTAHK